MIYFQEPRLHFQFIDFNQPFAQTAGAQKLCMYVCMYVGVYVYVRTHVVYVYMRVCACMCVCIGLYLCLPRSNPLRILVFSSHFFPLDLT